LELGNQSTRSTQVESGTAIDPADEGVLARNLVDTRRDSTRTGHDGYLHWQLVVIFNSKIRRRGVLDVFGAVHAEPTRSEAAEEYVWKDDTAVAGTRFELGKRPFKRNNAVDWETVRGSARMGRLDDLPANVYVQHYGNLRRIVQDNLQPLAIVREVVVYWGATGVGKSRRAWNEASLEAYPKDPRSKFWDGYRGQQHVVIDEFRGDIDIGHILRWFDRYPVIVEIKGSSVVLAATKIWITSNLNPMFWYPQLDELTREALLRRLTIFEMTDENTNLIDLLMNATE